MTKIIRDIDRFDGSGLTELLPEIVNKVIDDARDKFQNGGFHMVLAAYASYPLDSVVAEYVGSVDAAELVKQAMIDAVDEPERDQIADVNIKKDSITKDSIRIEVTFDPPLR